MNDLKNFFVVVETTIEERSLLCQLVEKLSREDELFGKMNEGIEENCDGVLFEVHLDKPIIVDGKELEREDVIKKIASELNEYYVEISDDDSDKKYIKEKNENEFKSEQFGNKI